MRIYGKMQREAELWKNFKTSRVIESNELYKKMDLWEGLVGLRE